MFAFGASCGASAAELATGQGRVSVLGRLCSSRPPARELLRCAAHAVDGCRLTCGWNVRIVSGFAARLLLPDLPRRLTSQKMPLKARRKANSPHNPRRGSQRAHGASRPGGGRKKKNVLNRLVENSLIERVSAEEYREKVRDVYD